MAKRKKKLNSRRKLSDEIPLPNTSRWRPRKKVADSLESAFSKRCIATEKLIQLRAEIEKQMNIDNFDSGVGLEDIIRNEFRAILPNRYSITSGVINDPNGLTAGDFDLVIFNDLWFPQIKAGATMESRRVHFPVDGVYAIGEIKQTLDFKTLDAAMKKLVICHRLKRRKTYAYRVTENREGSTCLHGLTNPLYSFILATDLREGIELDEIVERFFFINKSLKRLEVVRALCVLGRGTVTWSYYDSKMERNRDALFMLEDLYEPIFPSYFRKPGLESAIYPLIVNLMLHLYHSVLAPEDITAMYGSKENLKYVHPKTSDIVHEPDKEWLESLKISCNENHNKIRKLRDTS